MPADVPTDGPSEPEGIAGEDPLGLGLRFWVEDLAEGGRRLVARYRPGPRHCGSGGFLHGGMAAAALDETMASVSWAFDETPCVTATLALRFRRPVPVEGDPLRIEAWRERPGSRRSQKVKGRLLLPDGAVAVEAAGIFVSSDPPGDSAPVGGP